MSLEYPNFIRKSFLCKPSGNRAADDECVNKRTKNKYGKQSFRFDNLKIIHMNNVPFTKKSISFSLASLLLFFATNGIRFHSIYSFAFFFFASFIWTKRKERKTKWKKKRRRRDHFSYSYCIFVKYLNMCVGQYGTECVAYVGIQTVSNWNLLTHFILCGSCILLNGTIYFYLVNSRIIYSKFREWNS